MKVCLSHRSASRQAAKGLTLIEMMVSLVIGMVIVVAIVALYAGSSGAARTAEAVGRMNEDGQAALNILSQQIRMAGSNPIQPNYISTSPRNPVFPAGSYPIRGCESTFTNITVTTAISTLNCTAGTSTLPDSIAVSYEADRYNTVPTVTNNTPTDCVGSSLMPISGVVTTTNGATTNTTTVTTFVADNRFYIGTSTAITSPSLYCKGIGNINAQPMVENIEDMQFTYGTSPAATSTGTVAGYLTSDGVETDNDMTTGASLAGLPTSAARWARVVTVHICVLARTEKPAAADAASAKYVACNGDIVTPTDLRLRRAYHTTVVLRNKIR
jgi:type IV pilus assembly protein PilW